MLAPGFRAATRFFLFFVMENSKPRTKRFCEFGPFRLDTLKRLLLCDERVIPLASRVFDTLLALVQSAGEVLTKDELMRRVWSDTLVAEAEVEEVSLEELRQAAASSDGSRCARAPSAGSENGDGHFYPVHCGTSLQTFRPTV